VLAHCLGRNAGQLTGHELELVDQGIVMVSKERYALGDGFTDLAKIVGQAGKDRAPQLLFHALEGFIVGATPAIDDQAGAVGFEAEGGQAIEVTFKRPKRGHARLGHEENGARRVEDGGPLGGEVGTAIEEDIVKGGLGEIDDAQDGRGVDAIPFFRMRNAGQQVHAGLVMTQEAAEEVGVEAIRVFGGIANGKVRLEIQQQGQVADGTCEIEQEGLLLREAGDLNGEVDGDGARTDTPLDTKDRDEPLTCAGRGAAGLAEKPGEHLVKGGGVDGLGQEFLNAAAHGGQQGLRVRLLLV